MKELLTSAFLPDNLNNRREEDVYEKEDPDFNEKFKQKKKIEGIEVVEIASKETVDNNKVVFAPGFSRTPATFKNTMRAFYEKDRGVASLSHPRIFGEIKENPVEQELPKEVLRRATSLYKVIISEIESNQEKGIDKRIDIVGQSAGGIDAILAVAMVEEEMPGFGVNIVLVDPAGIVGPDSGSELKKRFKNQIADNKEVMASETRPLSAVNNQKVSAKEFFKYLLKNPKRAMAEIEGMTAVSLEEIMIELKKNKNIGISIIHGIDDKTFPMDMVQSGAEDRGLDAIDGFYSVQGGHNELYLNPDKYVGVVVEALSALERKQEKNDKTKLS